MTPELDVIDMIERNGLYWMPFRHASSQKRGVSVPSRESVPASKFASVFRRNLALLAQDPTAANDGQATVDDGPGLRTRSRRPRSKPSPAFVPRLLARGGMFMFVCTVSGKFHSR